MGGRAKLASLKYDEEYGTDNGDEVERKVHEVSDDGAGCELCERLGDQLAQLGNRVIS